MGCLQSILDIIDVDALQELIEENMAGYSNVLNIAMKITSDVAAITSRRRDNADQHIMCAGDPFAIISAVRNTTVISTIDILTVSISAITVYNDNFIFPILYDDILYFPHMHKNKLSTMCIEKLFNLVTNDEAFTATVTFDKTVDDPQIYSMIIL